MYGTLRGLPPHFQTCRAAKFARSALAMARRATVSQLAAAMCRGDRVALSRALTLVESKNRQNQKDASQLLSAVLPQRPPQSLRIGISGPPGTGKSTLIEALGGELVSRGHRLAVLAVDPSSQRSGGSIMGDKTRMPYATQGSNPGLADPRQVCYLHVWASPWTGRC